MSPPEPAPDPAAQGAALFRPPAVDVPTLLVLAVMWAGWIGNFVVAASGSPLGPLAFVAHTIVGVFFLNMSFTVWHEAAHGTVFAKRTPGARWLTICVGVLGAWPAMLPYRMLARVHNLHHAHTNDPERDPDSWFLEGSIWSLPLRYPRGMARAARLYADLEPPASERWADRAALALIPALLLVAAWQGLLVVAIATWILPKTIAMWIHAWYVNVAPHRARPLGRFQDTRIFPSAWLTPLCLFHNYHGLHHAWQTVPWHRYGKAFRAKRELLLERGAFVAGVTSESSLETHAETGPLIAASSTSRSRSERP